MPGFDRTGPNGQGSQTGRGLGKCNPKNQKLNEQVDQEDYSRGLGGGFGRGRVRNRWRGFGLGQGRGLGRGRS